MFEVPDKTDYVGNNPHLRTEKLTPLTERMPQFNQQLLALQDIIGGTDFTKYVQNIHNIAQNNNTLLITVGNELQRMHVQNMGAALKKVFNVERVQVIGIMKTIF
ncbi:hypothetical protein [Pectinatus frisingensis]|uniref:hypothetical protein n=1 Tax=Pectinatus frisingensis TaxID=865 RepID=UPI0015F694B5|nr:hypothetical protein [Pectinatus frisingensis]